MANLKKISPKRHVPPPTSTNLLCCWKGCLQKSDYKTTQELARHVEKEHFQQAKTSSESDGSGTPTYLCQWEGCKLFNMPYSSEAKFHLHLKSHIRDRPHKCILNGCKAAFWNLAALNRHLQLHFTGSAPSKPKAIKHQLFEEEDKEKEKTLVSSSKALTRCQTVEDNDGDNLSCHSDPPAKKPSTPSPSGPKLWFPRAKAPTVSVISHFSLHPTTMNAVKTVSQSIMTNWLESGQEEFDFLIKLHANVIGRRRLLKAEEDEVLVQWTPDLLYRLREEWIPISQFQPIRFVSLKDPNLKQLVGTFKNYKGKRKRKLPSKSSPLE